MEKSWVVVREMILLVGLGIMSIEDFQRKEVRRIWLIGLGTVGFVFAIVFGEINHLLYITRLVPGVVCLLMAWITREQIGLGDAFLILILGLYCNMPELLNVCMLALLMAGMTSLILLTIAKKSKKYELPLIPFVFMGRILLLCCA